MTGGKKPKPQAARIIDGLSAWISAAPGRSVTLSYSEGEGWRATMTAAEERSSRGKSALDCLAQVTQVAVCETTGTATQG